MTEKNEQGKVNSDDIVILVKRRDAPAGGGLIVVPGSDGRVDITNYGDSLFKAYNIHTGQPVVVYGDKSQSDTWSINHTSGYIQLEQDGRFHLHLKKIDNHPIQALPEDANTYGFPDTLPPEFIKPEKNGQKSFSTEGNQNPVSARELAMQHAASNGLSEEAVKIVENHVQQRENQQTNSISELV